MSSNDEKQGNQATGDTVQGRSVFLIETVPVGISVRTAFLTNEEKLLDMPAVFPNLQYALAQVEELRQHIIKHFDDAAKIGAQVIASQQAKSSNTSTEDTAAGSENTDTASADTKEDTQTSSKSRARNKPVH